MQYAPAQDRNGYADLAAIIVRHEKIAADEHAVLVESIAAYHACFDNHRECRLVALPDAQYHYRFNCLIAPVPVLADQDVAVLCRFRQGNHCRALGCRLGPGQAAIEQLRAAIDCDHILELLPGARGDAFQLLHDVGVDRFDLSTVAARAFAHFLERELRLRNKRRQIEIYRLRNTCGRAGAVLLAALMRITFNTDHREGLIHSVSLSRPRLTRAVETAARKNRARL